MKKRTLSRDGKIVRNLLLALLLFGIWTGTGAPLPTAELRVRRLERESLLPESQFLWRRDVSVRIFVGLTENRWTAAYLREDQRNDSLASWPLEEGPTPVPLTTLVEEQDEEDQPVTGNAMLFPQAPEEAARAVVQVTGRSDAEVDRRSGTGRTENFEGEAQGNGVFYFWMGPNLPQADGSRITGGNDLFGLPYTLKLYWADGSLLLEQAGTIPEA